MTSSSAQGGQAKARPHRTDPGPVNVQPSRWVRAVPYVLLGAGVLLVLAREFGVLLFTPVVQLLTFYPWFALGAVAVIALSWRRRQWLAVGAAIALAGVILWPTIAATSPVTTTETVGTKLRVGSANVMYGEGTTSLMQSVADQQLDVLVIVECSPKCVAVINQPENKEAFPFQLIEPGDGPAGSAIISTLPLTEISAESGQRPTKFAMPQAKVEVGGTPVIVKAAHPFPPIPTLVGQWKNDLLALQEFAASTTGPLIIAGDFNANDNHLPFREILKARNLQSVLANGNGTWPPQLPSFIAPQIDHILVSPDLGLVSAQTWTYPDTDHRAVVAEVELTSLTGVAH